MSSSSNTDSQTVPEWSTWLSDRPAADDIISSRMGMADIFLQSETKLKAVSRRSPSRSAYKKHSTDSKRAPSSSTSLRDLEHRYSSGVDELSRSTTCAVEAAVYFSILEALVCGALIRSYGITKAGRAISNVFDGRLERLMALGKDRFARWVIFGTIEYAYQIAKGTGVVFVVNQICAIPVVQVVYGTVEQILGERFIYQYALMLVRAIFFFVAMFYVLFLECGARITWVVLCAVAKCFMSSTEKENRQPSDSSAEDKASSTRSNVLVCLLCLFSIPIGFASFYYQLEAFDCIPEASIKEKSEPEPEPTCAPAHAPKEGLEVMEEAPIEPECESPKAVEPDAETLPDVCPIVMEPLDGDEEMVGTEDPKGEGEDIGQEPKLADDSCHYDEYANKLEELMTARRLPWNVEPSAEEDSVVINTGRDSQTVQPAFLAGRFPPAVPVAPPVPDMSALAGLTILLGLMQAHMSANSNTAVQTNLVATNKKDVSLDEGSPVGGEPKSDDDMSKKRSPKKVAITISSAASPTSSPSKSEDRIGENTPKQQSPAPNGVVEKENSIIMNGPNPVKKGEVVSAQPDSTDKSKQEQSGLLERWNAHDSLSEVSQMLLAKTDESPRSIQQPQVVAQSEPVPETSTVLALIMELSSRKNKTASEQSPSKTTTAEIGDSQSNNQVLQPIQNPRKLSLISETSSASTASTSTVVTSEALSPSPSASSLRSITTAMKKLSLTATAPPFIPKRKLSLSVANIQPAAPSLPLGVGIANRPPSEIWSPAPKVAVSICPPPPKKRRIRGRGRKALEAVASAAMHSINNENTAPSSRTMDINI